MTRVRASLAVAACIAATGTGANAGSLSLERFFRGHLVAKGQVDDLRAGSSRPFSMDMSASWTGATGTLVEDLTYADGERQHKVWTFEKTGDGHFVGHRADLTRDADVVENDQGVLMSYKANTRVPSGSTLNLAFEDRIASLTPDTVSVHSDVTYFFLPVARVTMTITRLGPK